MNGSQIGSSIRLSFLAVMVNLLTIAFAEQVIATSPPTHVVPENTVEVPKWLAAPKITGSCSDSAYKNGAGLRLARVDGKPGRTIQMLHSGQDLYVCTVPQAGSAGLEFTIRFTITNGRERTSSAPTYQFSLSGVDQVSGSRLGASGKWEALPLGKGEVVGLMGGVSGTRSGTGEAAVQPVGFELRVPLEWLGGYSRTDQLQIELRQTNQVIEEWPRRKAGANTAWGHMILEPLYPETIDSGSAFLDGHDGFLVVPNTPDLNPSAVTVEAWVKTSPDSCGTLVGNGRATSYWMAICQRLSFASGDSASVGAGHPNLSPGWHHVALSVSERGERVGYLDGMANWLPDSEPVAENLVQPRAYLLSKLKASPNPLRIGSDRDAPMSINYLHGYVRELRIWNRVVPADEIRNNAFHHMQGHERGLVGLWPFTSTGLRDLVNGHDAGLVGSAALARESLDVKVFPPVTVAARPLPPRTPRPNPAWDGRIATSSNTLMLDGVCRETEYARSSRVWLEPDRTIPVWITSAKDGLWICAPFLVGSSTDKSVLAIYLDSAAADLSAHSSLTVEVAAPDPAKPGAFGELKQSGATPGSVTYKESTGVFTTRYQSQDLKLPWWSVEVHIPVNEVARYRNSLRLALRYNAFGAGAAVRFQAKNLNGSWPAQFDPFRPTTWGLTARGTIGLPFAPSLVEPIPSSTLSGPFDPTSQNASDACGGDIPDHVESGAGEGAALGWLAGGPLGSAIGGVLGGILGGTSGLRDFKQKWPQVVDTPGADPTRFADGQINSITYSGEDWPAYHNTHDVDMSLNMDPTSLPEQLLLNVTDPPAQPSTSLIVETEEGGFPPKVQPRASDHTKVQGLWIFDCTHWPPHVELHPVYAIESDHMEVRKILDDRWLPVKVAQVWMNSSPGAVYDRDLPATFDFDVDLTDQAFGDTSHLLPFFKLTVQESTPGEQNTPTDFSKHMNSVSASFHDGKVHVIVSPAATRGHFLWELVLGYLDTTPLDSSLGTPYRLNLDQIEIHQNRKTFGPAGADWFFNFSFGHQGMEIWKGEGDGEDVDERFYDLNREFHLFRYLHPGDTIPDKLWFKPTGWVRNSQDPLQRDNGGDDLDAPERPLTLYDVEGGNENLFPTASMLPPIDENVNDTTDPRSKDFPLRYYTLHYRVTKEECDPPQLSECSTAWGNILSHQHTVSPGTRIALPTPTTPGSVAASQGISGVLTGPWTCGSASLLQTQNTADTYFYKLRNDPLDDEFADVTFSGLGSALDTPDLDNIFYDDQPSSHSRPDDEFAPGQTAASGQALTDILGFSAGSVQVAGPPETYLIHLNAKFRTVSPDPAAGVRDATAGEEVAAPRGAGIGVRAQHSMWSWQASNGEKHFFKVHVPPEDPTPRTGAGYPPGSHCTFDVPQTLKFLADKMQLEVRTQSFQDASPAFQGDEELDWSAWDTTTPKKFPQPDGHGGHLAFVTVGSRTVRNPQTGVNQIAGRKLYQLWIYWQPPIVYSKQECDQIQENAWARGNIRKLLGAADDPRLAIAAGRLAGLLGQAPSGLGPVELTLPPTAGGGTSLITVSHTQDLNLAISSPDGVPVVARLFAGDGVLVAESTVPTGSMSATSKVPVSTQSTLTVPKISAGDYALQLIPISNMAKSSTSAVRVVLENSRRSMGGGPVP